MSDKFEIIHDKEKKKFFVLIGDYECLLQYSESDNVLDFAHTYVPFALRGKGIAAQILKTAAEFAQKNNKKVIPSCSYAYAFFNRYPEYEELVL